MGVVASILDDFDPEKEAKTTTIGLKTFRNDRSSFEMTFHLKTNILSHFR
jgi:hypothetical protein